VPAQKNQAEKDSIELLQKVGMWRLPITQIRFAAGAGLLNLSGKN
jgi:hypothetical protein